MKYTTLWFDTPAGSFSEALPLGNGRLGAMIYGGFPCERISLNRDTLWSGSGKERIKDIPKEHLDAARRLIFGGTYYDAQQYIEKHLTGGYSEAFMPLGTLTYRFLFTEHVPIQNYRRILDLETAVHRTVFTRKDITYTAESFISYPDNIMALRIRSDAKKMLNSEFSVTSLLRHRFENPRESGSRRIAWHITGTAPSHTEPNYIESDIPIVYDETLPAIKFCLMIGLHFTGENPSWEYRAAEHKISVRNADEIELIISACDTFRSYDVPPEQDVRAAENECRLLTEHAGSKSFEQLKKRHLEDYRKLFNRVYFNLYSDEPDIPLNRRLALLREGKTDTGLYCLFFHYARYLLISASRSHSQPMNLQGIWNEQLRPAWSSNLTVNINTEMNYWPAGICNLNECAEPLWSLVKELSCAGAETAQKQFHCSGWVANHNVDLWRKTTPAGGNAQWAYWPFGGVWLSVQAYEQYLYTKDPALLRILFPALQGAARFCLDWLTEWNGCYHTAPSTSPENSFLDTKNRPCSVAYSSAMDISLIRQLFFYVEACYAELGHSDSILKEIQIKKERLAPLTVNSDGLLNEWHCDFPKAEPAHRHCSPLIAVHFADIINETAAPELYDAAQEFFNDKIAHGCGHIGWSCAWIICLNAGFKRSKDALHYLTQLLRSSVYPNLFNTHPMIDKNGKPYSVFQIDGNFGAAYGITRMLIQDQNGCIELLPALPEEWANGSVSGLRTKNGFECSIIWENGILTEARFFSVRAETLRLRYRLPFSITAEDNTLLCSKTVYAETDTRAGRLYTVRAECTP